MWRALVCALARVRAGRVNRGVLFAALGGARESLLLAQFTDNMKTDYPTVDANGNVLRTGGSFLEAFVFGTSAALLGISGFETRCARAFMCVHACPARICDAVLVSYHTRAVEFAGEFVPHRAAPRARVVCATDVPRARPPCTTRQRELRGGAAAGRVREDAPEHVVRGQLLQPAHLRAGPVCAPDGDHIRPPGASKRVPPHKPTTNRSNNTGTHAHARTRSRTHILTFPQPNESRCLPYTSVHACARARPLRTTSSR